LTHKIGNMILTLKKGASKREMDNISVKLQVAKGVTQKNTAVRLN